MKALAENVKQRRGTRLAAERNASATSIPKPPAERGQGPRHDRVIAGILERCRLAFQVPFTF
jgi:hypothetical protein